MCWNWPMKEETHAQQTPPSNTTPSSTSSAGTHAFIHPFFFFVPLYYLWSAKWLSWYQTIKLLGLNDQILASTLERLFQINLCLFITHFPPYCFGVMKYIKQVWLVSSEPSIESSKSEVMQLRNTQHTFCLCIYFICFMYCTFWVFIIVPVDLLPWARPPLSLSSSTQTLRPAHTSSLSTHPLSVNKL